MTDDSAGPPEPKATDFDEQMAADIPSHADLSGHFYRGEIDRMTTWRSRLDRTTNWAVVIVAAILTWAFSSSDHPHYVILIGVFGLIVFLVMEANRYRQYDVWRTRVRALQSGLFADVFDPDSDGGTDWRSRLGAELRNPEFELSFLGALTHRLRRTYLALLLLLLLAWLARITLFRPDESWQETASLFIVPGPTVVAAVGLFYAAAVLVTLGSAVGERVREF